MKVVVIGGGVMGACAAWRIARRGAQVVLLEQFGPRHDKGSSHGSSRIFRLAYPDRLYVDLAAHPCSCGVSWSRSPRPGCSRSRAPSTTGRWPRQRPCGRR